MAKRKYRNPASQEQAKKQPGGAPPSIVLHEIDVRPFGRREQDIPSWRNALRSAESIIPRRILLYDLYADVDLDGHVEAVTGKRRDAVTTANWQFVDKAGKPIDVVNELIDSIGFDDMLKEIMNSKFWGYSIMEPTFYKSDASWEMNHNLIPRLNYRPEKGIVARDHATDEGINIREGIYAKTVMEVGNPKDLGLYLKAAPYQILKRGGLGDWALFVQVFGNPIVDATWDGFDEGQRKQLLDAVAALGSGGAIVRPEGTNITLLENKTNANGDLQDKFMSFLNREISKSLLGSTETTESSTSSGYAQAETHAGQDERKNESDINFTRRVLNSRFIRILNAAGFDTQGGRFIVEGEDNELTIKESFDIQMALKDKGLPMDDDFFYETYGIPKPANYNEIKKDQEEAKKDPPPKGKDKPDDPDKEQQNLFSRLKAFFLPAPAETGATPSPLKGGPRGATCCGIHRTIELASPEPPFKTLLKDVLKAEGKGFIYPDLVSHNIEVLTKGFSDGWQSKELITLMDIGIDYNTMDPRMQTAWEVNIFRFSTVKAAYQSAEVNRLFRRAKNFSEFERAVKKAFGVRYKPWLITEYNTAYQTAEASATYYRLLKQTKTFPYWQYKTIGDERVRDEHRLLHDAVFPVYIEQNGRQVLNPIWKKIFPPNGWGCRCYVVPRLASEVTPDMIRESEARMALFEKTEEWAKSRKAGFGINRADMQEVFTRDQFYTNNPDKAMEKAANTGFDLYGLRPADLVQQAIATRMIAADTNKAAAVASFMDAHTLGQGAQLRDYAGRTLDISREQVAAGDFRHLRYLPEVINQPDEVWINEPSLSTFTYLKYFKNTILQVMARLGAGGELELSNWKEGADNRKGILIKK